MAVRRTIVFIHGMFLTPKSWRGWRRFFEERGYRCLAPAWPYHEEEPSRLRRRVPAGAGDLELAPIVEEFSSVAAAEPEPPVLIGHAVGGLVAQAVVARGLARAAVCLCSMPPNRMLSPRWSFLRNGAAIMNPLRGDRPFAMTERRFRRAFANRLTPEQAREAYSELVVPDSRNVMRSCLGKAGRLDLARPHAPLLFVAAEDDKIIPGRLSRRNAAAYRDEGSVVDFKAFPGRGHFILGEPGWEEVASYVDGWLAAEPWVAANRVGGLRA